MNMKNGVDAVRFKNKGVIIMSKREFIRKRTNIISKMLDNPDENGTYSTTICFAELDNLYDEITGCKELSWAQKKIMNNKKRLSKSYKMITEWISRVKNGETGLIVGNDYVVMDRKTYDKLNKRE